MLQVHTLEIRLTLKAPELPVLLWGQLEYSPAPLGSVPARSDSSGVSVCQSAGFARSARKSAKRHLGFDLSRAE